MPNDQDDPNRLLFRLLCWSIAAIVGTHLVLVVSKGVMCVYKGGCTLDEVKQAGDYMSNLLATIIALLMAVMKK